MKKIKITYAEISTTIHATEDEEKVLRAVENILPKHLKAAMKNNLHVTEAKGYYGNPMKRLTITLESSDAENLYKHIIGGIDDLDFENLIATIDQRFDGKNKIFIRLSKQDAYLSNLKLLDRGDVIRILFTVLGVKNIDELVKFTRELRELKLD